MKHHNHGSVEPWLSLFLQCVVGSGYYAKEKSVEYVVA